MTEAMKPFLSHEEARFYWPERYLTFFTQCSYQILQNASSTLSNSWRRKMIENSSSFRRGCLIGALRNLSFFLNLEEVILAFNNNNKDRFNFNQNF
jgi:hypothetical protein